LFVRWAKKDNIQYTGGRYIVFVAGGVTYSETRAGYELMQQHSKEVIIGSSHIITPDSYLVDIGSLHRKNTASVVDI
jgi:syntaxin-binding protein 1